ncbi:MAG: hypothetical protein Terrestrivirus1_119 [Terrestrivirus sp.]|uniref:Uncharacterized protein n=1 Tax=Terrestrivirus sp. TaxID=2487775 RepID=A0A3G4ZK78_9VIRU|nr:MAG: hypothetical protein Terrestrivirus1_119 [Terrestrivirus sp.]
MSGEFVLVTDDVVNHKELDKNTVNGRLSSHAFFIELCLEGKLNEVKYVMERLSFEEPALSHNKRVLNATIPDADGCTSFSLICSAFRSFPENKFQEKFQDKLAVINFLVNDYRLKNVIDFCKTDKKGNNVLHHANKYTVKILCEHFGHLVNVKNDDGVTPLHNAIWKHQSPTENDLKWWHDKKDVIVEFLKIPCIQVNIQIGNDFLGKIKHLKISKHYHEGRTALSMACYMANSEIGSLLTDRTDVDVNLPDAVGNGPLYYAAIKYAHPDICEELLKRSDIDVNHCYHGKNLLVGLSGDTLGGNYPVTCNKVFHHESFDVNFIDEEGKHALFYLFEQGQRTQIAHVFMVELIKNPKTNINAKFDDMSFLHLLSHYNSQLVVDVVDRDDTDLNCRNKNGFTALYVVLLRKNFIVAEKILAKPRLNVTYEFKFLMEQYEKSTGKEHIRPLVDENPNIIQMFMARNDLQIDRSTNYPRRKTTVRGKIPVGAHWQYDYDHGRKTYDYGLTYSETERWS